MASYLLHMFSEGERECEKERIVRARVCCVGLCVCIHGCVGSYLEYIVFMLVCERTTLLQSLLAYMIINNFYFTAI